MMHILLCGVGGQGTVLASRLLAAAAMEEGYPVFGAETIGMAQKGGSVTGFLTVGEASTAIFPQKSADLILAFEPAEAVRALPYLKENGTVVVSSSPIMPVTATLKGSGYDPEEILSYLSARVSRLHFVDTAAACAELGSAKVLNTVLLGAALASGVLPLKAETVRACMLRRLKPQFHELNLKALSYYETHHKN